MATKKKELLTIRASAAQRAALCPGSVRAESGIPDSASDDAAAAAGTRIHACLAWVADARAKPRAGTAGHAGPEEWAIAEAMWLRFVDRVVAPRGSIIAHRTEVALAAGQWTGHADMIAWIGRDAANREMHVVDWKSGPASGDVPAAAENAQLRAYVVMAASMLTYGEEMTIYGHIVTRDGISSVAYTRADINAAARELETIADEANKPRARRVPSAQACRHCRACGTPACPESLRLPSRVASGVAARDVGALAPDRLATILRQLAVIDRVATAVRAEARARLEADPASVPGWSLRPGAIRKSVADARAAIDRLAAMGVPHEEAMAACSFSIAAAARIVRERHKKTAADATAMVVDALGELVERQQTAPTLVGDADEGRRMAEG